MFAAAFIAMRTVRLFPVFSSPSEDVAAPTIIRFEPQIPKPPPKPVPVPIPEPALTPPPAAAGVSIAPPVVAPIVALPGDSASGAARRRITDRLTMRDVPDIPVGAVNTRGAFIDRAAVTSRFEPLTVAERDSVANMKMAALAIMLKRPFTKEERAAVAANAEPGKGLPNTRAGSDGKVVPLMNGGVAVGMTADQILGGSFPLPLFSSGPSPAERKRNAAIDSVNRIILFRLHDRARVLRDSLRADSLAKRIRP
jgi:hypothetical protein